MNILQEIQGLIFNLYLVYQLSATFNNSAIKINKKINNNYENKINIFNTLSRSEQSKDHNRIKLLSKIVIILLLLYFFFDIQKLMAYEIVNNDNIKLKIKDGVLYSNKIKIYLSQFIKTIKKVVIYNQNNYYYDKNNATYNEIFLIFLTNFLGINFLIFSNDLLITVISWELFNFSLYLLVSINSYSESSLSASLKYFILSAQSTGFLLLGITQIHLIIGNTNYDNIFSSLENINNLGLELGLFLILSTFLFKLSAAPFYNWAPDLYNSLNSNITKWMIIIPKITVLSIIYQQSNDSYNLFQNNFHSIDILLAFSGTLSLIIGSLGLINQWNIKRLLAYSGISHIGYILLALYSNDINYYIIYKIIYSVTTINILTILLSLSQYYGREIFYINQLIGIYRLNPFLAIAFAISLFSLAGKVNACKKYYTK